MDGTTRVYERRRTRIRRSSWVTSTSLEHNSTPDDASAIQPEHKPDAAVASCNLFDSRLHVIDAEFCNSNCASSRALMPDDAHHWTVQSSLMPDGPDASSADTVVRGGISVPLPFYCDLNEVPEAAPDEELLTTYATAAPVLLCGLNEIPEIVSHEDVSADMISEVLPYTPFHDMDAEKGEPVDGSISNAHADIDMDQLAISKTKYANDANINQEKLQTDLCLPSQSTATKQKHNDHENIMKLQTPQKKPRRKKHRPKVLVDGYLPRAQKKRSSSTFRREEELIKNKKTYARLSRQLTSHSAVDPDVIKQMTRKSTRRSLDFDSKGHCYPTKPEEVSRCYNNEEARGKKRGYSSMISSSINTHNTEYNSHPASSGLQPSTSFSNLPFNHFLEMSKRRRTRKGIRSLTSIECWLSTAKFLAEPVVTKGCLEQVQQSNCPIPKAKRSKGFVRIRRLSFSSLLFKFHSQMYMVMHDLITKVRVQVQRKKRSQRSLSKGKAWINIIKMEQLHQRNLVPYIYKRSSFMSAASAQDGAFEPQLSVDEIVERLQDLNINRKSNVNYRKSTILARYNSRFQRKNAYIYSLDIINGEENALVPFRRNSTIVPFIKKKLPRPRVDLDAETNRVWNLLLENINSPGIDGSDEETARQWKNERNVFRDRANVFIARMHLIQGDRRFSPWKGSVLDSVIGVFLTQNVSDHLSSSAFMSLAAKFPPKLKNDNKSRHDEGATVSIDTYESSVTNCCQSYVIVSHPEDDFEDPVNSLLPPENIGTQTPGGELGLPEISTKSGALEITAEPMIVIKEPTSAVELKAGFPPDKIPVVNAELKMRYLNCNHSSFLENPICREGCNSQTCEISEEVQRETEAILSDDTSQRKDAPWSLSRDFKAIETPRSHQLHLSSDLECETFDYIHNLETGSPVVDGSYVQLKEQASRIVKCTKCAHGRPPVCQGTCLKSGIGSCSCLLSATSLSIEFPAAKGSEKYTPFQNEESYKKEVDAHKAKTRRVGRNIDHSFDWDGLRKHAQEKNKQENNGNTMDSIDYEALSNANVSEIAKVIKRRGMNTMLAERIQDFVNGLVAKHGDTNLEWLRDILPDQAKEYLLTVRGLGLKSVECVRLLTLHQHAFPVDTNVGRIAVRLGWVPLQPLPESLQLHLLEQYPVLESIQKHLWPRLCKLDQKTLYELHYQMITFGKVFCTKAKPNCNSCPMRGDCRHFASEFASSRLALPSPNEKRDTDALGKSEATLMTYDKDFSNLLKWFSPQQAADKHLNIIHPLGEEHCEPIIEVPASPEPMFEQTLETETDIEDLGINNASECEDLDGIPTIKLSVTEFAQNLQNYVQQNMEVQEAELSKALVALTPEAASIPARKLKNASGLRTEHQVYVLPDSHPLLVKFDKREPDDPSPYLLAIWTPGETAKSIQLPEIKCNQEHGKLCNEETCLLCNGVRESDSHIVRGTILIPCRTATRGSFPLNGTYFQVNEVFADFHSSHNPIEVPRNLIWNLPTKTVFFGTSVPTIFRGMLTERIQQCFWKGFICVRGFDMETRAPRPLAPRLHTAKSLLPRPKK